MRGKSRGKPTGKLSLKKQHEIYQKQLAKYNEDLKEYQAKQSPWDRLTPVEKGIAIGLPVALLLVAIIIGILYGLGIIAGSSSSSGTTNPLHPNTNPKTHHHTHHKTNSPTMAPVLATNLYLYPGAFTTGAISNPDSICQNAPGPFGVSCLNRFALIGLDNRNISSLPTVFNFSTTATVSGPNGIPIKTNANGGWASMLGSSGTLTIGLVGAGILGFFSTGFNWWSGVDTNGNTTTSSNCANFGDGTTGSSGQIGDGDADVTNNGWLINEGIPIACNLQQNLVCGCTLP